MASAGLTSFYIEYLINLKTEKNVSVTNVSNLGESVSAIISLNSALLLYLISFAFLCCRYKWEAIDKDNKVSYTLKLCESSPSTSCGPGAAVCARNLTANTDQSVGECSPLCSCITRVSSARCGGFMAVCWSDNKAWIICVVVESVTCATYDLSCWRKIVVIFLDN